MVTQRTRSVDAQTVSDEHGKGAEVLRQHVATHWEPVSAASGITSNHQICYCEVDMVIRYLRLMVVDVPDANADIVVYRNRAGTLTQLAGTVDLSGYVTEVMQELTLTLVADGLRSDDSVYAIMVRDTSSTESADWGIYLGWMPDIFGANAQAKTY